MTWTQLLGKNDAWQIGLVLRGLFSDQDDPWTSYQEAKSPAISAPAGSRCPLWLWKVIRGLLDPDPLTRWSATEAWHVACLSLLSKTSLDKHLRSISFVSANDVLRHISNMQMNALKMDSRYGRAAPKLVDLYSRLWLFLAQLDPDRLLLAKLLLLCGDRIVGISGSGSSGNSSSNSSSGNGINGGASGICYVVGGIVVMGDNVITAIRSKQFPKAPKVHITEINIPHPRVLSEGSMLVNADASIVRIRVRTAKVADQWGPVQEMDYKGVPVQVVIPCQADRVFVSAVNELGEESDPSVVRSAQWLREFVDSEENVTAAIDIKDKYITVIDARLRQVAFYLGALSVASLAGLAALIRSLR